MRGMTDLLDAARIASELDHLNRTSPAALRLAVEVAAETGSTNADLRARAAGLQAPLLLAAERQTAGRGRAGRNWLATPGDSLCFSLAWRFTQPLHRLSGLSLAVGVALAETLRMPRVDGTPGTPVLLKWPNDLLVGGAKMGGILIETAGAGSEASRDGAVELWVVIGVGLNVRADPARDAALDQPAAALCAAGTALDRNALLAQLAASLAQALTSFDRDGLEPFVARWDALHAHAGQWVSIVEQGRTLQQGVARGIDRSGCLQVDTGTGVVSVTAGDVSLRAADQPSINREGVHAVD